MCFRPHTPNMQVGDLHIPKSLNMLTHLRFQIRVGGVQQHGCRVAHQAHGPTSDDDGSDNTHSWIEPDPIEVTPGDQRNDSQDGRQGIGKNMDVGGAEIVIRCRISRV